MPTKLYYFRTKRKLLKWYRERGYSLRACEEAWSGPGYYYARSRKHISKHVPHLDRRRGGKIGRGPWRHLHDLTRTIVRLNKAARKLLAHKAKKIAKGYREKKKKKPPKKLLVKYVVKKSLTRARSIGKRYDAATKRLARYLWNNIPRRLKEGRNRKYTFISVLALARAIRNYAREKGIDDVMNYRDWVKEIDWEYGYRSALDQAKKLIGVGKSYEGLTEKEIKEFIKWAEENARRIEVEIEPDAVMEWELKTMI